MWKHTQRLYFLIDLVLFYIYDLIMSGFKVALDVMTPQKLSNPRLIRCPVDSRTDTELTILANLISFSPGTIVVDVNTEQHAFVIHVMFSDSDDVIAQNIRQKLEARILRVMRGRS